MFYSAEAGNLSLAAAGDSLMTRRLSVYDEPRFVNLVNIIRSADVAFTNLEVLIHDFEPYPGAVSGGTWMRAGREILQDLKWAGFDMVSTANNHSLDYGIGGLISTIREVEKAGLTYAGTGMNLAEARAPKYLDHARGRVALLAASSSFHLSWMAGRQRSDMQGSPGLSGLRHHVEITVSDDTMDELRQVHRLMQGKTGGSDSLSFRGMRATPGSMSFVPGDEVSVSTRPHEGDLEDICRRIGEARRQADWVVFSLHAHENIGGDRHIPADFIPEACRKFIDAGADIVIGHGPHVIRGMEIHNGRPIMYSLGNFAYQNQTVRKLPQGYYDNYGLGPDDTPADGFDARVASTTRFGDPGYWETVVPVVRFEDWKLKSIELHPAVLGQGTERSQRGRPVLADADEAEKILTMLGDLSRPFNTEIGIRDGVGVVAL